MTTNGNWLWEAHLEEHFKTFYILLEQQKPAQQCKDENEPRANIKQ